MRRADWLLPLLAVLLLLPGCKRLTFVKPDPSHRGYVQVAPDYTFRAEPGSAKRNRGVILLRQSEQALQGGQLDEAERLAREAVRLDAGSAAAHTMLGVVADRRGQAALAGDHYARALALAPNQGVALNNRAVWLCGNGHPAESLPLFQRAIADPAYPTPATALANAGNCAQAAGQPAPAEQYLRQALQLQPGNPLALQTMAGLSLQQGRALEARGFIQRRLELPPASAEALTLAARIESTLGDNAASRRYLEELRRLFPNAQTP